MSDTTAQESAAPHMDIEATFQVQTTIRPFHTYPAEIREIIWAELLPPPRVIHVTPVGPDYTPGQNQDESTSNESQDGDQQLQRRLWHSNRMPILAQISSESRAFFIFNGYRLAFAHGSSGRNGIWFNFDKDILYLSPVNSKKKRLSSQASPSELFDTMSFPPSDAKRVKKVALAWHELKCHYDSSKICRALGNLERIYMVEGNLLPDYQREKFLDPLKSFSQWDPELIPSTMNLDINKLPWQKSWGTYAESMIAYRKFIKWQNAVKGQRFKEKWQTKTIMRSKATGNYEDDEDWYNPFYGHGVTDWKVPEVKRVVLTTRGHALDLWKGVLRNRREMKRITEEKTQRGKKGKSKMAEDSLELDERVDGDSDEYQNDEDMDLDFTSRQLLFAEDGAEPQDLPWID